MIEYFESYTIMEDKMKFGSSHGNGSSNGKAEHWNVNA